MPQSGPQCQQKRTAGSIPLRPAGAPNGRGGAHGVPLFRRSRDRLSGRHLLQRLSWTLDRETAEWFAHRFGEEGTVYEAQIPKKYILAFFNGRNESEVVVDPKHLEQIMESPEPEMGMRMT